jgi:hypothetical protein
MPKGIVGLPAQIRGWLSRRRTADSTIDLPRRHEDVKVIEASKP